MLTYDLSERGNTSLYQYLYQCILQDIRKGVIGPGEQLPSKRALASHLSVGLITVENAYAQLQQEGYIYSIPFRGYFVQSGPSEAIQEASSGEEEEKKPSMNTWWILRRIKAVLADSRLRYGLSS